MATIGLCMIVKNEAPVILRCLDSVRPLIDCVFVCDTGSTDGTQQIIRDYLARERLQGAVSDEPWQDFAHNRSQALAGLRRRSDIDYALIMDADDVLVCENGFDAASFKAALQYDVYNIWLRTGPAVYQRPLICRNRMDFRFRGVLHEFLVCPDGCSFGTAAGLHVLVTSEGARSRDPSKYLKDAAVLEDALASEADPFLRARYTFYLAQSWRDAGEPEKALAAYVERAGLGFWDEEVFVSLYSAAQLKEQLQHPAFEIIGLFLAAYEACPRRAEALYGAARYCRLAGEFQQGYLFARDGLRIPRPEAGLFVEPWIYDYGLLDEFAVNAYWIGRYRECSDACERLLRDAEAPDEARERIAMNARFAREKLAGPATETVESTPRSAAAAVPIAEQGAPAGRSAATPMRLVLICGPWSSGTTAIAGILERIGVCGLPPYLMTNDPRTPDSHESLAFREIVQRYVDEATLSRLPCEPGAIEDDLRRLQERIGRGDFGPGIAAGGTIFLKCPTAALLISEICEVFDTHLIYVMRPLAEIEQSRRRRNWQPHFGAAGAEAIYRHMEAARHDRPTVRIEYAALLADPAKHVSDLARFIGVRPSPAALRDAAAFVTRPAIAPVAAPEPLPEVAAGAGGGSAGAAATPPMVATAAKVIADWAERLPTDRKRIGIIVPYRDRAEHLQRFLPHLISFFHRDQAASQFLPVIVISEQSPGAKFNRGAVLNAGFLAIEGIVDYVCFHDVDYLPVDADYAPVERPSRIIWHGLDVRPVRVGDGSRLARAPRVGLGAVTVCGKTDFRAVNGFSNNYFGWGFEDVDLMERFRLRGIAIGQKDGTFAPLDHDHAGFADDGRPNEAWVVNEARCRDATAVYARHGSGHDGLSSFPFALSLQPAETVTGLAPGEEAHVIRLVTSIPKAQRRTSPPKENLVVVRCGAGSCHPAWLGPAHDRNWDLILCPYEPVVSDGLGSEILLGDVVTGPKWAGISAAMKANFGGAVDWRDYRYIWFPDDDLVVTQSEINRFFELASRLRAKLCSPALHPSSYFSHLITMANTEFVARRTTFVEIMMPCFAAETFATLAETIDRSTTGHGWGLDFVWPKLLDFDDVLIIDAVTVLHTRAVHAAPPEVYEDMARIMGSANAEPRRAVLGGYDSELRYTADEGLPFRAKLIKGWAYLYARWPQLLQHTFTDQAW